MSEPSDQRHLRATQNRLVFRSVNRRIKELTDKLLGAEWDVDFVCECEDPGCIKMITMRVAEFAAFDRMEDCFLVAPGHEDVEVDQAVARHRRYVVVANVGAGQEYRES
jgi:hypothetical protein